jgi:hypothetical protein
MVERTTRQRIGKNASRYILRKQGGSKMRAGFMGMAVIVVAIGLIWTVAVMSELVPVDGSEMTLAATSPHVGHQALVIR